jgi:hypothetical protein
MNQVLTISGKARGKMGSITPQPESHKSPEDEPENSVFKL